MAELSADAAAIVDRLKREGDLSRNSGINSIRSVKIELGRFQDIFKSISTNIATQNNVLKLQTDLAKDAAEKAETQDQFKEIELQNTRQERDESNGSLVTEKESKVIDSMGNSITRAINSVLSFKNLALAGAGIFVGYNLLKGFIDEKTGGGFTEFEKSIGPFAKSLPIIGAALTDFPGTLSDLKTTIEKLGENLGKLSDSVGNFLAKYGTPLAMLGGLIGLLGFGSSTLIGGLASLAAAIINAMNKGPKVPVPTAPTPPVGQNPGAPGAPGTTNPGTPGTPGKTAEQPKFDPKTGRYRDPVTGKLVKNPNPGPVNITPSPGSSSASKAAPTGGSNNGISDPKMSKVFSRLVKGLGAIGIGLTAYQLTQLMGLIDNPKSTQKEKQVAVSVFLSEMIGAVAGGTAGAIIGAFGGPWGSLIFGVLGAGLGALGGSLIAEYIAKWAFEEGEPSQEDIDKRNRQIGIDQYLDKVNTRPEKPMNPGKKGFGAQAKAYADWNAQYGETHNPDGTPKFSRSTGTTMGGRGSVVEQPGEKEAYMKAQAQREAELKEINKSPSSVLTDTPESMVTGNANRRNGLNTVAGSGSSGSAIIINAPVSAPSSVNVSNGGSSVNQLSISGGGGGSLGPSMLPYGLTNAFS